jgi:hypothetical protein
MCQILVNCQQINLVLLPHPETVDLAETPNPLKKNTLSKAPTNESIIINIFNKLPIYYKISLI